TYDALNRMTKVQTPETYVNGVQGAISYAYDNFDKLTSRTDARNVVTTYTYDSLNRLTGIAYTIPNGSGVTAMPNNCTLPGGSSPNANVCFTYGTTAASYNNGRLITMTDGGGSENYTYNKLGLVTQLQKGMSGTTY